MVLLLLSFLYYWVLCDKCRLFVLLDFYDKVPTTRKVGNDSGGYDP